MGDTSFSSQLEHDGLSTLASKVRNPNIGSSDVSWVFGEELLLVEVASLLSGLSSCRGEYSFSFLSLVLALALLASILSGPFLQERSLYPQEGNCQILFTNGWACSLLGRGPCWLGLYSKVLGLHYIPLVGQEQYLVTQLWFCFFSFFSLLDGCTSLVA